MTLRSLQMAGLILSLEGVLKQHPYLKVLEALISQGVQALLNIISTIFSMRLRGGPFKLSGTVKKGVALLIAYTIIQTRFTLLLFCQIADDIYTSVNT